MKRTFLSIEQEAIAWMAFIAFAGDACGLHHLITYFSQGDNG